MQGPTSPGASRPIRPTEHPAFSRIHPVATSAALDWAGIQADHHSDMEQRPCGIELPGMTHHMLVVQLNTSIDMDGDWDGRRYKGPCRTGDLSLVPAHRPARWRWRRHGLRHECLHVFLDPFLLARAVEAEWDRDPASVDLVGSHRFTDPGLLHLSLLLRDELLCGGPGGRLLAESTAAVVAVRLLRGHSTFPHEVRSRPAASGPALLPRREPARRLRRALDLIEADLGGDLSLKALAGEAALSRAQFVRAFKAATGMAPHAYVLRRRVERAQELLLRTDAPLAEVALAAGFSGQSHLTAAFRARTGATPARFRQAVRS